MFKEIYDSFKDNFKERTTNPFLGTLLLVGIFHYWELLFAIFNFNGKSTLNQKIYFIKQYLKNKGSISGNILELIGVAMLTLVCTYALLNLSRLIINFYEKIITPLVYKTTDKRSIVLKADYDKLSETNGLLEKRIDELREEKRALKEELERLEKPKETSPKVSGKVKKVANDNIDETTKKSFDDLINKFGNTSIDKVLIGILKKDWIRSNEMIDTLLTKGLVNSLSSSGTEYRLSLTAKGENFRNYFYHNVQA